MLVIKLQFPGGRFKQSWPPSPFLLARSMALACLREFPQMQGRRLESVLDHLCAKVDYSLPDAQVMQAAGQIKVKAEAVVFMLFQTNPTREELFDIKQLLSVLTTIGDSPSWVDADIRVESETVKNCTIALKESKNTTTVETLCSKIQFNKERGTANWVEAILSPEKELQAIKKVPYSLAEGLLQPSKFLNSAHFVLESKHLPDISETLHVAETVRRKLMGISRKLHHGDPSKVSQMFSGKNSDGSPSVNHRHAYFLPYSSNNGRKVNELAIISGNHFARHDIEVLKRLTGLPPDIAITLKSLSNIPLYESKVWVSATPFVTSRHHRRSRGSWAEWMKDELLREIRHREQPLPTVIELLSHREYLFKTTRKNAYSQNQAFFRLTYENSMSGPFSLGSLAHFGIGLFLPGKTVE